MGPETDSLSLTTGSSMLGKYDKGEDEKLGARFATTVWGEGGVGERGEFF